MGMYSGACPGLLEEDSWAKRVERQEHGASNASQAYLSSCVLVAAIFYNTYLAHHGSHSERSKNDY